MIPELRPHQIGDIEWIRREGRGLLANEPGLGKSRSAIAAFDGGRNLVVAPNLVIEGGTWADELGRWSQHPDRWQVVPYSQLNERVKTARGGTTPIESLREQVRGHYDALIVDEAHYTKGRKSSWTWAVEEIAGNSDSVLEMTGTPIPNWAQEIYPILRVVYPEEQKRGSGKFGGFWRWANEWFDTTPTRFSGGNPVVGKLLACNLMCEARPATDPCEHYYEFAAANFGSRFRRILRSDVLDDLPPMLGPLDIHTPMDQAQTRMYRELKKNWASTTVNGQEILAWSQGALNVALDKVTTSAWCLDPVGPACGGKFETLRYELESRARPTVVFAHYRVSVEGAANIARQVGARVGYVHGGVSDAKAGKVVRDFKAGELDVLVGSLETLSEGLTLTQADMAIFVEMSYKPSRNEQGRRRIHRMGQTHPVTVHEYLTPNTVDERKRELLAVKTDHQLRMLTAAEFSALL